MPNDLSVQPPQTAHDRKIRIAGAAVLMLVAIAAAIVLEARTRTLEGIEPIGKSANERVSEAFEDTKDHLAPVSDELKNALASLSQNMQGAQKPPVRAEGQ
jgi:hypothetical protein